MWSPMNWLWLQLMATRSSLGFHHLTPLASPSLLERSGSKSADTSTRNAGPSHFCSGPMLCRKQNGSQQTTLSFSPAYSLPVVQDGLVLGTDDEFGDKVRLATLFLDAADECIDDALAGVELLAHCLVGVVVERIVGRVLARENFDNPLLGEDGGRAVGVFSEDDSPHDGGEIRPYFLHLMLLCC